MGLIAGAAASTVDRSFPELSPFDRTLEVDGDAEPLPAGVGWKPSTTAGARLLRLSGRGGGVLGRGSSEAR